MEELLVRGIVKTLQNVKSENPQHQLAGLQSYRELLLQLQELIHKLKFEAAWTLALVASDSFQQTRSVMKAGAVPVLVQLLSSKDKSLVDNAVWALGSIAGNGAECRDFTIHCGIIQPLIALVKPTRKVSYLQNVARTLSNICSNEGHPLCFEAVQQVLPALACLLRHADTNVVSTACLALSHLLDKNNEHESIQRIQAMVDAGVVPRLVELLGSRDNSCVTHALCTIGNILTGTDQQKQVVLDCEVLQQFTQLLRHHCSKIKRDVVWMISNITAGNRHHIECVVNAGLIPAVIDIMIRGEYGAREKAVWAITNITAGGSTEQRICMVQAGALKPLCDMLVVKKTNIITVILDALINILNAVTKIQQVEQVCLTIKECGGLEKIKTLQQHSCAQVYHLANSIIDKFFPEEHRSGTSGVNCGMPSQRSTQNVKEGRRGALREEVARRKGSPNKKLLTYKPAGSTIHLEIMESDLDCLSPGEYLTDKIIDFYLMYLYYEFLGEEHRSRVHIFSSAFYSQLKDAFRDNHDTPDRIHDHVKIWTRHVDLFSKDFIVLPISETLSHWYVAFICYPGLFDSDNIPKHQTRSMLSTQARKVQRRTKQARPKSMPLIEALDSQTVASMDVCPPYSQCGTMFDDADNSSQRETKKMKIMMTAHPSSTDEVTKKEPCIMVLDSLGVKRTGIVKRLRDYLTMEWMVKKQNLPPKKFDSMKVSYPGVQFQDNPSDGAVFVLQYVENFLKNVKEGQPLPSSPEAWGSYEETNSKRADIKTLILNFDKRQS